MRIVWSWLIIMLFFDNVTAQSLDTNNDHEPVVIKNVNYIDVLDGTRHYNKDIVIEDGLIQSISEKWEGDQDHTTIDGSGRWLLPGLWDTHIHLFQSGSLFARPDALDLRSIRSYEEERKWILNQSASILSSYLAQGITNVIDLGGPMTNYKIRSSNINDQNTANYFCTGPLISTYQPQAFLISDPPIIKVETEIEARQEVQNQLPYNPNFIKIWYISLPLRPAHTTYDIIAAAVDESHKNNLKVAIHATQLQTAKLALKAGADILVHSVSEPIDDEFIDMMIRNKAILIPTITVHGNYDLAFSNQLNLDSNDIIHGLPEVVSSIVGADHINHPELEEARSFAAEMLRRNEKRDIVRKNNLIQLINAGIPIATGTDAGNIGTLHATSYQRELQEMKEAGMTNAQILKASTYDAAAVLSRHNRQGRVANDYAADLILLNEDPLEDLNAFRDIHRIILQGQVIDPDTVILRDPENLVQTQLNAYNARNIEAFIHSYSDDIRVFNSSDELLYTGKNQLMQNYKALFRNNPELHCQLVNRIVLNNTVIDHERITGLENSDDFEAIAIYKIIDGKIAEVYFDW